MIFHEYDYAVFIFPSRNLNIFLFLLQLHCRITYIAGCLCTKEKYFCVSKIRYFLKNVLKTVFKIGVNVEFNGNIMFIQSLES